MRKSLAFGLMLAAFLCFFSPKQAHASHAMGVDISYSCLGGNTYQFTLNFYRDCAGISAPGSVTINLNSTSCAASASVLLTQVAGSGLEVSPLCPASLPNSSCSGGGLPGVQQFTYQGTYTFTQQCTDWVVSFDECCRNNQITTLSNPGGESLLVTASLDNTVVPCNSSPTFTSLPVPYICANQSFCYNHGAVDVDGDSLYYRLIDALDGPAPGTPVAYNAPFSGALPVGTASGSVQFDSLTGSLCFTPNAPQVAVIVVEVEEWRNGVLIGITHRDIQIVVQNCINQQPDLSPRDVVNVNGAVRLDSNSIEVCPGAPFSFDILANDPNALDSVFMFSNATLAAPGSNFTTNYTASNAVTGTFSWTPTVADVGFYNFTVTITDDGCPILGSQIFNFDITVVPATEANPGVSNYCPAGSPVQLNAVGGTNFSWSTISGGPANLSCNNCPNPTAAPTNSATVEVISNLSAICKNRDTIVINLVPDFVLNPGNDTTICRNGLASLGALAGPAGFSPYTFSWSPTTSLSNPNIANPFAAPTDSTRYYLSVTSAVGCTLTDSVDVNVDGVAPQVVIDPVDTLCQLSSVQLNSSVFQDCGVTSNPCSGPVRVDSIGSGAAFLGTFGPHYMATPSGFSTRRQYFFTAAELNAMGFTGGGRINEIAVFYAIAGTANSSIQIRMGCVSDPEFLNGNFYTTLDLVKAAAPSVPNTGWTNFVLDFPYLWDGQSNLVVEFCSDPIQVGTASDVRYSITGHSSILYANRFNLAGACSALTGTQGFTRPDMRFNFCEALPASLTYSWSPPVFLNNSTIADPLATPGASQTYTLNVSDGICVGTDTVSVIAAPQFTIDAGTDTTVCQNVPVQFNAFLDAGFGPYTYSWTPALTLNSATVEDPIASPTANTRYYLTARSADGCELTDSIDVSLSGVAPLVSASPDDTICPGDALPLLAEIRQNCGVTTAACSGPSNVDVVGTGVASTSIYGPHYLFASPNFQSLRRQYIYTAAELNAQGFFGGKITEIALYYETAGSANTDIVISMGCTSTAEYDASNTFVTGLTVVKNSFSHLPTAGGFNAFVLDNDYIWDGTSNLVVEFCTNSLQSGTASNIRYTSTGTGFFSVCYANRFNATGACSQATGIRTFLRPNMQFTWCSSLPAGLNYTWSNASTLDNPSISNPTASPNSTTTYSVTVDDGGVCDGLDFVTITIDSSVYVQAAEAQIAACNSPVYQLNSSVTGSPLPPTLPCGINGTPCTQPSTSAVIGSGTFSASTYSPFYQQFQQHRSQFLIPASELQAAGFQSGIITQLSWNVTTVNSTQPYENFTISMGCTNATDLSLTSFEPTSGVVWGPSNYSPALGPNTFNLTFPFDWDGTSNVVVEVCNSQVSPATANESVEFTAGLTYNATSKAFGNTGSGCSLTPLQRFLGRPNITFTVCPPPPLPFTYNWTPAAGVSNTSIANPTFTPPDPGTNDTLIVEITGGACTVRDTVITLACPLPVDGLQLDAERAGSAVELTWATQNEVNLASFEIQRSANGGSFQYIGSRSATGVTQGSTTYTGLDPEPKPGLNSYRIKAIDINGAFQFSNLAEVTFLSESGIVGLYPNPNRSQNTLHIDYFADEEGTLILEFIDVWGRRVLNQSFELKAGLNQLTTLTGNLAQGSYFARLSFGNQRSVHKLMIVD